MTCKWLKTMVIVSPLRIGLWDPFRMAELSGVIRSPLSWDDPPRENPTNVPPASLATRVKGQRSSTSL